MSLNNSLYSSDKMDWGTPIFLFKYLNALFNFTLDACAGPTNYKHPNYFSVDMNALTRNWHGRVFLNPPYGKNIGNWISKARQEVESGNAECVVCLVPVRSDSKWWHANCMLANEIWLLDQRIEFEGSTNKAPFPVALIIFNGSKSSAELKTLNVRPLRERGL